MAKTLFDLGRWTPQESWRTIRTIRSSPPRNLTPVLRGDRKKVFHMALEQAQELYEAASKVGYETRPLLLFYGLSQAGRAIASASDRLGLPRHRGTDAEVIHGVSHGLDFYTNLPAGAALWQSTVKVVPTAKDSFSRACLALDSSTDVAQVELGAIASQLLEFLYEFRDFDGWPRAFGPTLTLHRNDIGDALLELTAFDGQPTPERIRTYLTPFRALAGCEIQTLDDGGVRLDHNGHPSLLIPRTMVRIDGTEPHLLDACPYLGDEVMLPSLGTASQFTHPLLSWWMLLFSLSMLARYAPKDWAGVLDLTANPNASQIEYIQDAALTSVPQLLAEVLTSLNK